MSKISLTARQAKLFKFMDNKQSGSFVLDEAINVLFGKNHPTFERQKTISIINGISRKMKCRCCYVRRVGEIGRGKIGNYHFRIECTTGSTAKS